MSNTQAIGDICSFIPTELNTLCDYLQNTLGPILDELFSNPDATVDTVCYCLNLCLEYPRSGGHDNIELELIGQRGSRKAK